MKRPPAAASKIVTLTISPIPKWKARGGRRSVKEFENLGSYRPRLSTTSGVSLTRAYGRLSTRPGTTSVLADTTSVLAGPLAGMSEQPPRRKAEATIKLLRKYCTSLLPTHPTNSPARSHLRQPSGNTAWPRPTRERHQGSWKLLLKCNYW